MAIEAPLALLLAYLAFDAGVYFHAARGAKGELERAAEPVAFASTAAAIAAAALAGGTAGAAVALVTTWSRAGFDALHLGDGNILEIDLAPDYALVSLLLKGAGSALFVLFGFQL